MESNKLIYQLNQLNFGSSVNEFWEKQKRGEAPFLVSSFVNESSSYSHVKIVPLQSGSSG